MNLLPWWGQHRATTYKTRHALIATNSIQNTIRTNASTIITKTELNTSMKFDVYTNQGNGKLFKDDNRNNEMYESIQTIRQRLDYKQIIQQQQRQLSDQRQFVNFNFKQKANTSNSIIVLSNTLTNITNMMSNTLTNPTTTNSTTTTLMPPSTNPLWSTMHEVSNNTNSINITGGSLKNVLYPEKNSNYTNSSSSVVVQDDADSASDMLHTIEYIGNVLCFYYVPIIVGTGSIGNILSVFVFFKTKLRKLSSSFYLAALAVSDTCFLLGLFAQWLNFVDVHIYNREYFCQFFTFFSSLACFCSVWFVVAFTVERFIAVMYPLRRQTMCTVKRAKMVLVGLTVMGCCHCAPFWIYSTPVYSPKLETTICDIKSEYKDYITILNYWDTVVVFAVPFTTIAVLNTFTGCTVWKFATVRRTLTMQKTKTQHLPIHGTVSSPSSTCSVNINTRREEGASATTTTTLTGHQGVSTYRINGTSFKQQKSTSCITTHSNGQQNNIIASHQQHQQDKPQQQHIVHQHRATMIKLSTSRTKDCSDILTRKSRRRKVTNSSQLKVTKMLLIVSTVFVCLNLPSCIMRIITFLETQSSANTKTTVVLQYIFHLLFITNFGINFVLYCVSGQNFRKAVLSMFRRVSTTQRDGNTQITVSEYYRNSGGIAGACGANTSTRRRLKTQNSWNEIHELQRLK